MPAGVYLITCTKNGNRYVGSARNPTQRRREHWCNLRLKRHHNTHMQNVWNKYGPETFVFEVLEEVEDIDRLIEREQYWIDTLRPELNKAKKAESGFQGLEHTDETRARLAEIQRQRMQSAERRQRLREAATEQNRTKGNGAKGKPVPEERRQKLREATARQFADVAARTKHSQRMREVMTPEVCARVRQSKIGAKASAATKEQMSRSHRRQWDEYTPEQRAARIAKTSEATRAARAKRYDGFVAPDGAIYRDVYNLTAFCREHGLLPSQMTQVYSGKRQYHHGWRRLKDDGL